MIVDNGIAKALRIKRAKLSLTKKAMAQRLNLSDKTYRRLEKGNWKANKATFLKVLNWLAQDYE